MSGSSSERIGDKRTVTEDEKPKTKDAPQFYDIWSNEQASSNQPAPLTAPKRRLPTNAESYNPPPEYLPTEEERKQWEETDKEDRDRDYLPQS